MRLGHRGHQWGLVLSRDTRVCGFWAWLKCWFLDTYYSRDSVNILFKIWSLNHKDGVEIWRLKWRGWGSEVMIIKNV